MPAVTFANLWYLTIFLVLTSGALSCSQATSGGSGGYYLLDAEGDGSTVSGADTPGGSDTVAPSDTAAPPDIYTGDPTYDGPACTTSAACKSRDRTSASNRRRGTADAAVHEPASFAAPGTLARFDRENRPLIPRNAPVGTRLV